MARYVISEITLWQHSVGFDQFVTLYENKSEWLDPFVRRQWFKKWLKSLQVAKWEMLAYGNKLISTQTPYVQSSQWERIDELRLRSTRSAFNSRRFYPIYAPWHKLPHVIEDYSDLTTQITTKGFCATTKWNQNAREREWLEQVVEKYHLLHRQCAMVACLLGAVHSFSQFVMINNGDVSVHSYTGLGGCCWM